jgi:alkylation response protein AidB-like acyl-CoA dehydrogenase
MSLSPDYPVPERKDDAPVFGGPEALLEALRPIARRIEERAGEIEAARALPRDLFEEIAGTGLFRMAIDPRHGGAGYRLPDAIPIIEELGRADGSTAWSMMLGSEIHIAWTRFQPDLLAEIYAGAEPPMTRGALTPKGRMTKVKGGYVLDGQWPLASGSYPTEWFLIISMETDVDGRPLPNPQGLIEPKLSAVPAAEVEMLDTWHAMGLRATESDDIRLENCFVPDRRTAYGGAVRKEAGPLGQMALNAALGTFHVGVVLGIARGMLDDLALSSATRKPIYTPTRTLGASPLFQKRYGLMEVRLAAARAFALSEAERLQALAESGEPITTMQHVRHRSMVAHVHQECLAIANEIFSDAGTAVLYDGSPQQRRFRDMRAACQHIIAGTDICQPHGAFLLGQPIEPHVKV